MTGLETHPILGEYRLAELRQERERRVRRTLARHTLQSEQGRRGGSRAIRALPMRIRDALHA
jgi:hypothetical protein